MRESTHGLEPYSLLHFAFAPAFSALSPLSHTLFREQKMTQEEEL
jgi:hypothetical protein